ncbi:hypothetical protein QFZ82_000456 [Streptomyces sp. V4I23]|nr:hypothetical protein [Streptomyces sp. V4I23]MDQ1005642.1 hypothetical protein [Streptomyces sp. V4I23]MDQ1005971.1 hypothetical protein [Streptomyces sp. V4I23]
MSPHRWDFISKNGADLGVKRICRVLEASRAGYYPHLATEQARTERRAEAKRTVSEIRAIHAEHQGGLRRPARVMLNCVRQNAGSTASA